MPAASASFQLSYASGWRVGESRESAQNAWPGPTKNAARTAMAGEVV
jgi:hypothetical protein